VVNAQNEKYWGADKVDMSIIKNAFVGVSTKIAVLFMFLLNTLLIIKMLGPKWQGIYFMIIVTNGIILNVLNFGMNISNTTFLARDKSLFRYINSNMVILSITTGIVALICYLAGYKFFHTYIFKEIDISYILISICILPFSMYEVMWISMMVGLSEIVLMNKILIVKNTVSLILNFVMLVIFRLGFHGAFYTWISVILLSSLIMAYMANRRNKFKLRFYPEIFKKMQVFGAKNYWGNIATNIWRRLDVYLIGIFSGIAAVGCYSLAVTIRDTIWVLIEPIHNAAYAKITKLDRVESSALTSSLTRHLALNCSILSAMFAIAGVVYIKLILGDVYQASILPLIILLISPMGVGVSTVISIYLVGQLNKPNLVSIFAWINAGINVLLCLSLVPKYGIIGAAVSSTLTCIIGTVLILMVFKRFSGYGIKDTILARKDDILYYCDIVKKLKNRFLRGQT